MSTFWASFVAVMRNLRAPPRIAGSPNPPRACVPVQTVSNGSRLKSISQFGLTFRLTWQLPSPLLKSPTIVPA
jgi:hypothetical protein